MRDLNESKYNYSHRDDSGWSEIESHLKSMETAEYMYKWAVSKCNVGNAIYWMKSQKYWTEAIDGVLFG